MSTLPDKTQLAVTVFDKHALTYQTKYMDQHLYHDTLDIVCNRVGRQGAAVLDVACGPGNVTKYLLSRRPDFRILGIDLAPAMLELARVNNPTAEFRLMDGREIGTLPNTYDAIVCAFVLPYLSKEEAQALIHAASQQLEPGGVLYLSTMEDAYSKSEWQTSSSGDKLFMHYHEAAYLVEAIAASGLTLVRQKRQDYPSPDGKKVIDLVLIAIR